MAHTPLLVSGTYATLGEWHIRHSWWVAHMPLLVSGTCGTYATLGEWHKRHSWWVAHTLLLVSGTYATLGEWHIRHSWWVAYTPLLFAWDEIMHAIRIFPWPVSRECLPQEPGRIEYYNQLYLSMWSSWGVCLRFKPHWMCQIYKKVIQGHEKLNSCSSLMNSYIFSLLDVL